MRHGYNKERDTVHVTNKQTSTVMDTEKRFNDTDEEGVTYSRDSSGSPPKKKPFVRVHFPPDEQMNEFFSATPDNRSDENGESSNRYTTTDVNLSEMKFKIPIGYKVHHQLEL